MDPYPGFPDARQGSSHFHALARAIVFQQLAGAAARTIHDRVAALTPGRRFPTAAQIDVLPDESLRGAGLSQGKLAALRDLSKRSLDGRLRLRSIARLDDEEIIEQLVEAPDDLGLQEGLRRLDGLEERPKPKELAARGEVWAPLRSVASWVLWRMTELRDDELP